MGFDRLVKSRALRLFGLQVSGAIGIVRERVPSHVHFALLLFAALAMGCAAAAPAETQDRTAGPRGLS